MAALCVSGASQDRDAIERNLCHCQRMPKNESFGVFSSKSSRDAISKDDTLKLHLTTTCNKDFQKKVLEEDARVEPMGPIFFMGKTKTKYLPVQLRNAPLHNKTNCNYHADFQSRPPQDHDLNLEFAELCRPTRNPDKGALDARTTYTQSFASRSQGELERSQPLSYPHDRNVLTSRTTGTSGKLIQRVPLSQEAHSWRGHNKWTNSANCRPSTQQMRARDHHPDLCKSLYHADFGPLSSKKHPEAGNMWRSKSVPLAGGSSLTQTL